MPTPLSHILHKLLHKNHSKLHPLLRWSFRKDYAAILLSLVFPKEVIIIRYSQRTSAPSWKDTSHFSISILEGNAIRLEMDGWVQFFRLFEQLDQGNIVVDGLPSLPIDGNSTIKPLPEP